MERMIKILDNFIFVLLCILIFCLPVSNAIIEITASLVILLWLIKKLLLKRLFKSILFRETVINYAILGYLVVLIISIFQGSGFMIGLRFLIGKTLEYLALYLIIIDTFNSRRRTKILLIVLLASVVIISVDCLVQYFTKVEFLRLRTAVAGRIAGPFEFPDQFGNYLTTILPLAVVFSNYRFKRNFLGFFLKGLLFVLIFIFLTNNSKGSFVAFFMSFVFLAFFYKNKRYLLSIPIFFIIAYLFISPFFKNLISSQFNLGIPSFAQRFDLWQTSWSMFKSRPLFGQGLGTYMSNFKKYRTTRYRPPGEEGIWYAHNSYLQMLAETGIFGLFSFLVIIYISFRQTIKALFRYKNGYLFDLLLAVSCGLLSYLFQIFFDSTFYSLANIILFWYILGFQASIIKIINNSFVDINNDARPR